jgi:ABC-type Na+ efflux pump permease subunit
MRQILTIALREITRLSKRFSGSASPITVVLLLAALGLSSFVARDAITLGNGLYRVGVAGNVPPIQDSRFAVTTLDPARGSELLDQGKIDVFINGAQVLYRKDDKSLYAVSALKRYLEKQELTRVSTAYEYKLAFPLRVGIHYLDPRPAIPTPNPDGSPATGPAATPLEELPDDEVVIPSLMVPPAPFTQVILALLFVLPVTFISIFFTSSFMDEKLNRRLTILMSAPITPFQIIIGKMLPYFIFAMISTAGIAALTHADVWLSLAIFAPTVMFIFAIYLMVPMFYRTFKDVTFISMLVTTLTTAYLVFPAMFTGSSDLAYMSPLTLAVQMYRGEAFGWREYLFPSLPMAAIFCLAIFAGTRMLNEEYLMGYRPFSRKLADAVYLMMNRSQPYISVGLFSLVSIPVIYLAQLVILAIASNLPPGLMLAITLVAAALIEEIIKSVAIVALVEHGIVRQGWRVLVLAALSALGFLIGEKLLLFFSVSIVAETSVSNALFSSRGLLLVPLFAHFVFTSIVSLIAGRRIPIKIFNFKFTLKFKYSFALLLATAVHAYYNLVLTGGVR